MINLYLFHVVVITVLAWTTAKAPDLLAHRIKMGCTDRVYGRYCQTPVESRTGRECEIAVGIYHSEW